LKNENPICHGDTEALELKIEDLMIEVQSAKDEGRNSRRLQLLNYPITQSLTEALCHGVLVAEMKNPEVVLEPILLSQ